MSDPSRHPLRKVLAGTDFSVVAEAAVEQAARLAAAAGAELRLVHAQSYAEAAEAAAAQEPATLEAMRAQALRQLEQGAAELRRRGLVVSTCVEHGQPSAVLLAEAAAWGADLLVAGTRGLGGVRRLLLGSTARLLAERAACPVLVVHGPTPERRTAHRRVLVATDFSADAQGAVRRAAELLGLSGHDTVVLTHAVHAPAMVGSATAPFDSAEVHALVRHEAEVELDREAEALRAAGLEVKVQLLDGVPPETLVREARDLDADFVVIGSSGRTGLSRLLLGSTAERVLQLAPCPVLVVPSRGLAIAAPAERERELDVPVPVGAADEQC